MYYDYDLKAFLGTPSEQNILDCINKINTSERILQEGSIFNCWCTFDISTIIVALRHSGWEYNSDLKLNQYIEELYEPSSTVLKFKKKHLIILLGYMEFNSPREYHLALTLM